MMLRKLVKMDGTVKTPCRACELAGTRIQIVNGEGSSSEGGVVVIGEAPGGEEDEQGRPFVGAAGKILRTLMLEAGVPPESVWITNVVKCRPPGNRRPTNKEKMACRVHLEKEIAEIKPIAIITVGLTSAQSLLDTKESMAQLIERAGEGGIPVGIGRHCVPVFVCYHSSPLCTNRTPGAKAQIREAIKKASKLREG